MRTLQQPHLKQIPRFQNPNIETFNESPISKSGLFQINQNALGQIRKVMKEKCQRNTATQRSGKKEVKVVRSTWLEVSLWPPVMEVWTRFYVFYGCATCFQVMVLHTSIMMIGTQLLQQQRSHVDLLPRVVIPRRLHFNADRLEAGRHAHQLQIRRGHVINHLQGCLFLLLDIKWPIDRKFTC